MASRGGRALASLALALSLALSLSLSLSPSLCSGDTRQDASAASLFNMAAVLSGDASQIAESGLGLKYGNPAEGISDGAGEAVPSERRRPRNVKVLSLMAGTGQRDVPEIPVWPEQFYAEMVQQMDGRLSKIELWYDWTRGRNLNLIHHQLGSTLWDVEWNNGTSFYFDREATTCRQIEMGVGILRRDWLEGAEFLGTETINTDFECYVWTKADFITYYEEVKTRRPVRWNFHSRPFQLDILRYEIGATLPDELWQAPKYCFLN